MIKKKLSNAVILGSSSLSQGNVAITNEKLNQTQDRIELDHRLNYNQITNCILEAPNGVATLLNGQIIIKGGVCALFSNGRNADETLKNIQYTTEQDYTLTLLPTADGIYYTLILNNNNFANCLVYNYYEQDTEPLAVVGQTQFWLNRKTNLCYHSSPSSNTWESTLFVRAIQYEFKNSSITNFKTFQPVELMKRTDLEYLATFQIGQPQIGDPILTLSSTLGENEIWLNGAAVSRTTYSKLFKVYGTTYGSGNGSTTFNLPSFSNKALWGATSFGTISAGLPNISGHMGFTGTLDEFKRSDFTGPFYRVTSASGAYRWWFNGNTNSESGTSTRPTATFDASRANSIYGKSTTVQPPAIKVRVKTRYQ